MIQVELDPSPCSAPSSRICWKPELLLHNSSLRTQPLLPVRQPCVWVMLWNRHVDMRPGPGLTLSNRGVGLGLKPPSVLWLFLLMFQWLFGPLATRSSFFSLHPFAEPQLHSKWLHVVLKEAPWYRRGKIKTPLKSMFCFLIFSKPNTRYKSGNGIQLLSQGCPYWQGEKQNLIAQMGDTLILLSCQVQSKV